MKRVLRLFKCHLCFDVRENLSVYAKLRFIYFDFLLGLVKLQQIEIYKKVFVIIIMTSKYFY